MDKKYESEIDTYYAQCIRDYEIVWQLKDSMALHYGYWDETTLTHRQALWNMNYHLARHAQITGSDKVLDAGCGVGGTGFFLAKNLGCHVHGISLTPAHTDRAELIRDTQQQDIAHLCEFSVQDFSHTNFADESFDVVIGIESIVHATPKIDFLKEANRVLKPGGRLIIADYFCRDTQNELEVETLKKWGRAWAINDFINEKSFCEDARTAGFQTILLDDIADQVFPSVKLMHRSYYPGIFISRISNFFGRRTKAQVINSQSGLFQYQSYRQGVWRYKYFLAIKPPVDSSITSFSDYMKAELPIEPFIDKLTRKDRFPIITKKGFNVRSFFKRIMHWYLETGIRNREKWF